MGPRRRYLRIGGVGLVVVTIAAISMSRWLILGGPEATLRSHEGPITDVAYSPDGKTLATGGVDRIVRLWDLSTRREVASLRGHAGFIESVSFSKDGKTLATTATHDDRDVRLWDVTSRRGTAILPRPAIPTWAVRSRLISPDGTTRVEPERVYPSRTFRLVDAMMGRDLVAFDGHPDQTNDWAWSPDGTILATGGGDTSHPWPINAAGDVRLWDARTGRLLTRLDRQWGAISDVEFSPDGRQLASASYDGTVMLWDVSRVLGR